MKITTTALSIPPYLSTTWDYIASIQTELVNGALVLIIHLEDGSKKEIPGLDGKTIEQIFEAHAQFLETPQNMLEDLPSLGFSLQKEGELFPSFEGSMQHNPNQAKIPNLPRHILLKIAEIAKVFGLEDIASLPDADPECNCVHCQLLRVMKEEPEIVVEESVTDADLAFENWKIEQIDDKLYQVANPLDLNENYQVFLGDPVGCTCGNNRCEHIQAVLRS